MIDKITKTLKRHSMLKKGMRVLACVSGGPDSVAMLYALNSLRRQLGIKLSIVHVNHKLRGRDSDRDEEYVRSLARRLKLAAVIACEDIRRYASVNKLSLEDAARRVRYNLFLKAARDLNADLIATAHTRDDQAETILMRLLRGTGLRGLRGILPKTDFGGSVIIRPLIDVSRKEIESYIKTKKIKPRLDTSNLSSEFFRNKIRLKLLPLLEREYSPRIKELLHSLAQVIGKDYECLDIMQQRIFKRCAIIKEGNVVALRLKDIRKSHLSLQRAFIRKAVESLKGNLQDIDYRHWKEIEDLLYQRPVGSIVHLPGAIEAQKTQTSLKFFINRKKRPGLRTLKPMELKIPGVTLFNRKSIRAHIIEGSSTLDLFAKNPMRRIDSKDKEYFDIEKLSFPLRLRCRKPGDKMTPFGMRSHKKVSDIFIDEKVPLKRRSTIPLVVTAHDDIIWLCGIRMSDKYKITDRTKQVLKLEFLPR